MADTISRILIVDDYEPWRRFVSSILQKYPNLKVVGEASDGVEGVEKALLLQPDLILLDIGLPQLNGIEAARRIREQAPKSLILFVSALRSREILEAALVVGRCGYVLKSNAGSELLLAVETVLEGKGYVSAGVAGHELTERQPTHDGPSARRRHRVEFYPGDSAFVASFASSIESSLRNGNVAVVLASESHHIDILEKLKADGVNVGIAEEQKFYIPLELADSLTVNDLSEEGMTGDSYAAVEAVRTAVERGIRATVG